MTNELITLPDHSEILQAVGRGIQMFASVELAVGFCFASMMEPAPRRRSIVAINSHRSFEGKMKMVSAVATECLTPDGLMTWKGLALKIKERKSFRDKLAHWAVTDYPGAKSAEQVKMMKAALLPPVWTASHMQLQWGSQNETKDRPIFLSGIVDFHERIAELSSSLFNFAETISAIDPFGRPAAKP